ncbi:hypothetical protein WMY93_004185 [Mugilogobius chulae]|uniref:Bcl-2 Bcl-2 homology region 1-3 domain-containing protein n=1 Tax=Mugilogobius chulae TaxID=88201 RepID=A0AAW0PWB0_9GOBI
MCQSETFDPTAGLSSPDPLVREAYLMAHDYIEYVTSGGADGSMGPAPTQCTALYDTQGTRRDRGDSHPDADEYPGPALLPPCPGGGRRRELAWSAVLSVYVLAGQMAQHCHESGMEEVLPRLKASVGAYVERVICPEIRDKGGWSGFVSRFGQRPGLESRLKAVCCWSLLALAVSILS